MKENNHLDWKSLPKSVQETLLQSSKTLEYKRGETIYRPGDKPQGLYFVNKGLIGIVILGQSGKEHLLRFFREGQFFGHRTLFSDELYHASTIALETSHLLMVPKEVVFSTLEEHPSLHKYLIQVLTKELRRCEVQHVMVLENQVLSRTAQALIYLKDLHPDHQWTRQEIANFCASTVSTVIKALAKLESLQLIRQEGRKIEITDRNGLINLQEESFLG